jgi:hypothetical protein
MYVLSIVMPLCVSESNHFCVSQNVDNNTLCTDYHIDKIKPATTTA